MDEFDDSRSERSTLYEQIIEHIFLSEVLQEMWFRFKQPVEVLKAEIDAYGYDIVLESGNIIRHIQLKSSSVGAKNNKAKLNIRLADKPSGCAVWVFRAKNEHNRMELKYRFFGNPPGLPLPDISTHKVAKHNKANAEGIKNERPDQRVVTKSEFIPVRNITELVQRLFIVNDVLPNTTPEDDELDADAFDKISQRWFDETLAGLSLPDDVDEET